MSRPGRHSVFARHSRDWRTNLHVYPVISRRSGGLSIGINLNPDKACNFDCIYCQVDRSTPGPTRGVDPAVLRVELEDMIRSAVDGSLYDDVNFRNVPPDLRRLRDIAFSGDGEPTTCPQFPDAVRLVAELRQTHELSGVKVILITDACYLTRPTVVQALEIMDRNHGEIWAKLDAGTEEYYRLVNRPNYPLSHVLENILCAARLRPVVIQALFMRVHGSPPEPEEVAAFCGRLNDIVSGGGRIKLVQVYTIARNPAEAYATPLSDAEVDTITATVQRTTGLPAESYYSG